MIEYTIRPVTRWVLTRYEGSPGKGGDGSSPASCTTVCEVGGLGGAEEIGRALAAAESGAVFQSYGPTDLGDIPMLLRRIAAQIEGGELAAESGVLTLKARDQSRPAVFGFGLVIENPVAQLEDAIKELHRLSGIKPPSLKTPRAKGRA